MMIDFVGLS